MRSKHITEREFDSFSKSINKKVDDISKKVDLILTNHLPHIELKIEKLAIRLSIIVSLVVGAVTISVQMVLRWLGL